MSPSTPAPRGLRWAGTAVARALTLAASALAVVVSGWYGYQYTELVDCLSAQNLSQAARTAAIAHATDLERAADLRLIEGGSAAALREAAAAARRHTDAVRAANPAPPVKSCG